MDFTNLSTNLRAKKLTVIRVQWSGSPLCPFSVAHCAQIYAAYSLSKPASECQYVLCLHAKLCDLHIY